MKPFLISCVTWLILFVGCGTTMTTVAPQWESMGGPHAQDISTLLIPGASESALYAGTENGAVFMRPTPDAPWSKIASIREGAGIYRLVRDPEKPSRIFAATEAGLFVSGNNGVSWTEIPLVAGESMPVGVRVLAIDPYNASTMFAGTRTRGILRSTDGGTTWNPSNTGIAEMDSADVREILVDISKPDRILAATIPLGVVQSIDAGKHWSRLTEEFTRTGSAVTHLIEDPLAPTTVVYGTNAGSLRRSTDGGMTWSPSRNASADGKILSLSAIPNRPEGLLAGTESGLLISTDFGTSWTDMTGSLPHIPLSATPSSDGRTVYVFGEGIGLQQSADSGATWTHIDANLGGSTIRLVTTDQGGTRVYVALSHAVLAFDPSTGTWQSASSGLPGGTITSLVVDSDSPLHLFAATSLGGYQSENGGQSWALVTRGMRITPKILEPHPRIRTRMLAAGNLGLDVSTDKGITWTQAQPPEKRYHVSAFTYSPTNTGVIYGAAPQAAIMSKDGGLLWESSRYGLHGEDIVSITLDDHDPAVVYAWTSSGGGYRSLDAGLEWNKYVPPWKEHDTVLVAHDRYTPSRVVALVNGREVYYSSTGGGTWFHLPTVRLKAETLALWWNDPSKTMYVGTKGKGLLRLYLGKSVTNATGETE
jgi:photosystem II stability/assembly factor-like uncharacterized protein